MKTIGQSIREYRQKKKISIGELTKITKIKSIFLEAIENEQWSKLPEYPVVRGFVSSVSEVIGGNKNQLLALLRRDYIQKKLNPNPKPDVANKFSWGPRMSLILGTILVSLIVVSYLTFQYVRFVRPPKLEIIYPSNEQKVAGKTLTVEGKVDPEAVVYVNNQPALVNDDGTFTTQIEVFEGTGEVVVRAVSRSNKETTIVRKIVVQLGK